MIQTLRCTITALLLAFISLYNQVTAQYNYRHITTHDGLLQGSVYYFLEDKQGFMWMSTQAGLNRFDGHNFVSYVHDDEDSSSISKGEVRGITQAPDGDIWVGTEVGLSRYVAAKNQFTNYYARDKNSQLKMSHHLAIYASDSTVLCLNDQEGLVRFNYRTGLRKVLYADAHFQFDFKTDVVHYDTKKDVIWLKQPVGLLRQDLRSGSTKLFFTGKSTDTFDKSFTIYGLFSNESEHIWISTDKGLIELKDDHYQIHQPGINMSADIVFSMTMDSRKNLLLATSKSGIIIYNPEEKRVVEKLTHNPYLENKLTGNYLSKVFIDSHNIIWANIEPKGVDIISPRSITLSKFDDNMLNKNDFNKASIRGIAEDNKGNLWVGTSGEWIRKVSTAGLIKRFFMKNGASPSAVRGIMNDSNGVIWICTINGLFKVSPLTENFEKITFNNLDQDRSNYIKGILEISNNQYVVATMAGLFSLKNSKITPITDHREGYSGTMYYNPQSKYFYAGRNDKDLACYRLNGDQFTKAFEFLAGYSILCVLPDPNDHFKLWIGTDNGLIEFDQHTQKIIRKYSIKDGLPNQVIYSLLLDNNNDIWISTNKGLVCRSRNGDFQKIRQSEEIEFNSFAAHKARTGIMYFGSTQGLYYFNPEVFKKSSSRGLKISSVVINDSIYYSLSEQQPRQPISLKYTENNLTVSLSALDYLSKIPPIFEYRRITDNDSTPWIKTESSIVHFQNLPSDHYHFEFRVLDSNGFYTKPEKLEFNINLPLWKKWWFLLLLLIFIAGVIYRFTKMYIYRQQLRQQKITKRIISAQESERLRIAMDIHDDVNNTLAAAKGYLQQTGAAVTAEYTERSKALIQKATEDLRNITHELMPIDFDRYNLRDVIEHKTDEWNQAHEAITFVYIQAGDPVKLSSEAELIAYRIIMEIIQNIIKHSGALQAVIQLVYTDDSLVISIEDNGAGFSQKPAEKNGGIGLKNVYLRAEYLHANLEISSDKKGVLAQLMIPYDHNRNDSGNPG